MFHPVKNGLSGIMYALIALCGSQMLYPLPGASMMGLRGGADSMAGSPLAELHLINVDGEATAKH